MRQFRVGQLVAGAPTFRYRHHQAAAPQAGQMIGHALPRHPRCLGQIGRVTGPVLEGQQDSAPGLIGQGVTEASEHRHMRQGFHNPEQYIQ